MAGARIVSIGAASTTFGPKLLRDMAAFTDLAGSTLVCVDIDPERLEIYAALAQRVSDAAGVDYTIEATDDRRGALKDADFVVEAFAVGRAEMWRQDFQIPLKHGVKHVTGECGGPGALMHTCRNVPVLMDIAEDIEDICPDALTMVATNPEGRLMMALDRFSMVHCVGLCHGVEIILQPLAKLLEIPSAELEVTAAGINHFTWIQELRRVATGEDVLPELLRRLSAQGEDYMPLTRRMCEIFGLLPSPGDLHAGEYLQFAWEILGTNGPDFEEYLNYPLERWPHFAAQARGDEPLDEYLSGRTWADTLAYPIMDAMINNNRVRMAAVNVPNEGFVPNLPEEAIVEVPAYVDATGVHPVRVDPLPTGIAALCRREIDIQGLAVDAAITGDRNLALQALLADAHVSSLDSAEKMLDELLGLQADLLPQFTS
jgi:alpha-galactosidase/6-phospho-beta-glucosidase family protein